MKTEYAYIGRCLAKGCKVCVRVSVPVVSKTTMVNVNYFPGANNPPIYEPRIKYSPAWMPYSLGIHCVAHKWALSFKEICGTVNEDHVCDSRCTGARGTNCDCSCGGANHGKAFSIAA